MPTATVQLKDGRKATFAFESEDQLHATIAELESGQSAVEQAGGGLLSAIRDTPRQLGLTARYAAEGAASLPAMLANIPAGLYNAGADLVQGDGQGFRFPEQNAAVSDLLTRIGLPQPRNAAERVVSDASRTLASAGTGVGLAQKVAQVATGAGKGVLEALAAAPGAQGASAVGSGLAGGSVREAGGSEGEQAIASLLGGLVAPAALYAAGKASSAVRSGMRRAIAPKDIEGQVRIAFERVGVDWNTLSREARAALVKDLEGAIYSGQPLDEQALGRLAAYRAIGATPLAGDVTQNPNLITTQRNLAKTQANMTMPTAGPNLPEIQNANAKAVLAALDEPVATGSPDAYGAGKAIIDRVQNLDEALKGKENQLYSAAREAAGQDIPLDRAGFINRAFDALARENKDPFLPAEIRQVLNNISKGTTTVNGHEVEVPFDVATIDKLKTMLATASRGTKDGNTKAALSMVRQALDDTQPVAQMPTRGVTLPATPEQAAAVNSVAELPAEALKLLDRARAFARSRRGWQESADFIEDALTGAEPDKFMQKHVINGSVENMRQLKKLVGGNVYLRDAVRAQMIGFIKQRGRADADVTRFTSAGLEDGLKAIGDRKLAQWFSLGEINRIKSAIKVAKYSQSQPIGSAVNNSNTAAMMVGKLLDKVLAGSTYLPIFGEPINAARVSLQARQLGNVGKAVVQQRPRLQGTHGLPATGLAAAAIAPPREDDRRK